MNGQLVTILLGVAGAALLCFGADGLVRGGAALARIARVPSLVIGLTVVAFGTSAPELVVSIDAALRGAGDIAIGNVVGSNICNIALILGVSALVRHLPVNRTLFKLDLPAMTVSTVLLTLWCLFNGGIGRFGGALFCLLLAGYLARRFHTARHDPEEAAALTAEANEAPPMRWYSAAGLTALGIVMLVLGAKLFVDGAVAAARLLHVSEAVIGLTVVALGTSLPELATSVAAALRNECDIAIGNVVGSNLFNVLCILGVAPLVSPIPARQVNLCDFGVMCLTAALLWVMMLTGKSISRREGGVLLTIYVLYVAKLAAFPGWGAWRGGI
jgi:cation:H+ antiporter